MHGALIKVSTCSTEPANVMSDPNVNVDAATVANVVSGVINALGLQKTTCGSTNSGASESASDTSGRASTRHRPNTRLAIVPYTIKQSYIINTLWFSNIMSSIYI